MTASCALGTFETVHSSSAVIHVFSYSATVIDLSQLSTQNF